MCGNSMRSDILPALKAGAFAAYIPYPLTWEHELAEAPTDEPRYRETSTLAEAVDWMIELG